MISLSVLREHLKHIDNTTVSKTGGNLFVRTSQYNLTQVLKELKNNEELKFLHLTDLTAVHYPKNTKEFDLIYILFSHEYNTRVILKLNLTAEDSVTSIYNIYTSALWLEREVFDMFGIVFENHPNLTRILNDEDFDDFPLRKEFPENGNFNLSYNENTQEFIKKEIKYNEPDEFNISDFMGGNND